MKILKVHGKVKNSIVNIYGEIHDDIDNSFYESLNLDDQLLLVEHSTKVCHIKPHEEVLFENAKGSEWVFKNYHTEDNLMCIDQRAEKGFLTGYQERELYSLPVKELLPKISYVLKIAVANKDKYLEPFDFNSFIRCIQIQTLIVAYLSMNPQKVITLDNSEIPAEVLLPNVKELLIKNTIKIASIYVDFYIIKILEENESSKPISIFVGMNHAMRLAEALNLKILNNIKGFPIDPAGWEPMGDPKTEAEILSQLKKNSFGKIKSDLKYLLSLK